MKKVRKYSKDLNKVFQIRIQEKEIKEFEKINAIKNEKSSDILRKFIADYNIQNKDLIKVN